MDHGPQLGWDDVAGLEFAKKTIKDFFFLQKYLLMFSISN
jgi:hypothetical protein